MFGRMGTVFLRVRDLLRDGASLSIHCFCLRRTIWTPATLQRFVPELRVWTVVEGFRCDRCGRSGKIRDMVVHDASDAIEEDPVRGPRAFKQVFRGPGTADTDRPKRRIAYEDHPDGVGLVFVDELPVAGDAASGRCLRHV